MSFSYSVVQATNEIFICYLVCFLFSCCDVRKIVRFVSVYEEVSERRISIERRARCFSPPRCISTKKSIVVPEPRDYACRSIGHTRRNDERRRKTTRTQFLLQPPPPPPPSTCGSVYFYRWWRWEPSENAEINNNNRHDCCVLLDFVAQCFPPRISTTAVKRARRKSRRAHTTIHQSKKPDRRSIAVKRLLFTSMTQYLSADKEKELVETAALMMTKGKGLLAADESTGQ